MGRSTFETGRLLFGFSGGVEMRATAALVLFVVVALAPALTLDQAVTKS